jgi:simple sugar transport system permease protein
MSGASQKSSKFQWRLERNPNPSRWIGLFTRIAAVASALLFSGIVIKLVGFSPLFLVRYALKSTLGSTYGLEQVAVLATPLILTGLSIALCMRMRLWNIGAEGQLYMGAWAATAIGIHFTDGPPYLMFIIMFLAAALAGALWILIPALARAYLNVNEILTTLMLNFVSILFVSYFSIGPWRDRTVGVLTATYRIPYELPTLSGSLHIGFIIAILIAVILFLILGETRWGYEVTTIGGNQRAAEFAGIPVARSIITVMLISGAISGIAGMIEVTGTAHRLSWTISNDYGFTGIIAAALANASPLGTVVTGSLLAVLLNAGIVLQTKGLSVNTVMAINGLILLLVGIGEVASQYQIVKIDTSISSNHNEVENTHKTSLNDGHNLPSRDVPESNN